MVKDNRKTKYKTRIIEMLRAGSSYTEIVNALGCNKSQVSIYAKQIGLNKYSRYNWKDIQYYHNEGHSIKECCEKFGFHYGSWHEAVERGDIVTNLKEKHPNYIENDDLFIQQSSKSKQTTIRHRIIKESLKNYECRECRIVSWMNKYIQLQLHHINGVNSDNRLDNLEFLCPNCHSQTNTFSNRNYKTPIINPKDTRSNVYRRLVTRNRPYMCEICGTVDWNNKPLSLQVHHIDGNRKNNQSENLQILCYNCHSQTDNHNGKKQSKGLEIPAP